MLGGNYLIHAVPDMVTEQIAVWVYGSTQTEVSDNLFTPDRAVRAVRLPDPVDLQRATGSTGAASWPTPR